jgi:hypothetical protein
LDLESGNIHVGSVQRKTVNLLSPPGSEQTLEIKQLQAALVGGKKGPKLERKFYSA